MKYSISLLLLFATLFVVSCSKDNEPSNPFGIDYSAYENASLANGFIMYQDYGGPRIDLAVDTAYLLDLHEDGYYQMCYFFIGSDSLKITLRNYTSDYNYHSDAQAGQNLITVSVFNTDTINMASSALSIQPQQATNNLNTVLNLHTSDGKGNFNGIVEGVVLLSND